MDEDEGVIAAQYEFVPAGEHTCERCMALAHSRWSSPPTPPHAHCECEVVPLPSGVHHPRDCGDTTWDIQHIPGRGTARYGVNDESFEWGFTATIDCWDGLSYEFEIWLDMGTEEDYGGALSPSLYDDLMAFAWSELYDEVEAVAARVCRPCDLPLVS